MSFRHAIRFALFFGLIAASAVAEERCLSEETPRQCLRKLLAARLYDVAQTAMKGPATGVEPAGSPIQTAAHDFQKTATTQVDGSSARDSKKALTLAYNLPSSLLGANQQTNVVATLKDPALSDAFLNEANEAAIAQRKKSLGHGDDVAISVAFNPLSQHFGRSIEPHRALFESILFALVTNPGPATAAIPETSFDTPFVQIIPDAAARMNAMIELEAAANAVMPSAAATRLAQDFARLAGDQPQLFFTYLYHHRKPEVGPRERGYRVTWEIGADNLNGFRRNGGRDCESQGTCLAAFSDYANRTASRHTKWQLALAMEFHDTLTNVIPEVITAPPTTEKSAHELTLSAAYGREIASFAGVNQGRFDFAVSYDAKRSNITAFPAATTNPQAARALATFSAQTQLIPPPITRFSATATVTQPIGAGVSILFSIGWKDVADWIPATYGPTASPQPPSGKPRPRNLRGFEVRLGIRYQPSFSRPSPPSPKECCCR